jgi:activating signal cointegrator complex subunit 3
LKTGSGKTLVAELAILRLKSIRPKSICVYIAPLKALAGERVKDWKKRFGSHPLNWNILELSGDTHHDQNTLERADILVCTPEKWDLVSRGWRRPNDSSEQTRASVREYISRVGLLIMDEVHLLGEERGVSFTKLCDRNSFHDSAFTNLTIAESNDSLSI